MCAMLPRLVGGADESLKGCTFPSRPAEPHVQLPKVSWPLLPFDAGGGGVDGLDRGWLWEAV